MKRYSPQRLIGARFGFSLVELLVGVAIGMVGLLVIFKTIATWDVHVRSTTSGGESESTGTLTMFNIERDIKQAGLGIGRGSQSALGCTVNANDNAAGRGDFNFQLAPVRITFGASGKPDTLDVLYGNSSFFVDVAAFAASTTTTKVVATSDSKRYPGFKAGDLVVASDGAHCQLLQVTDSSNADGLTVTHATGSYTNFYDAATTSARFNGVAAVTFATGGSLFDLGPKPSQITWKIDTDRLIRTDNLLDGTDVALAEGVVSMKAEYGIDADGDNKITSSEWTTTLPTPVDWTKVRAIRFAILVRSKQFEKSADPESTGTAVGVTTAVPTWAGSDLNPFVMFNVGGTTADTYGPNDANPDNWRYYRYRVYEKEVPLRNVIWATAPPS